MENTLVSVCIPAYNAEKTLRRTLDSILVQGCPNVDVLICDNSSTDMQRTSSKSTERTG